MLKNVLAVLLFTWPVAGQQPQQPAVQLQGSWTASSGSARAFRGTWNAEVRRETPDTARGSWTVLDAGNRIVLQGTWSARKDGRGWQGSWSAVVVSRAAGRSASGPPISGTWKADSETAATGTLLEMLQRAIDRSVGGTWRSGSLAGQWAIKGSPK